MYTGCSSREGAAAYNMSIVSGVSMFTITTTAIDTGSAAGDDMLSGKALGERS